jgi:hypothetical protein
MAQGQWIAGACLLSTFFSTSISSLQAQPVTPVPVTPPEASAPTVSLAELEKLIGGRTTLTLKLENATLEEVTAAMSQSSGVEIMVKPERISTLAQNRMSMMRLLPPDKADAAPPAYTPPPPPRFTLEAKEQPFWEALFAWRDLAVKADMAALKAVATTPATVLPNGSSARQFPRRTPLVSVQGQQERQGLLIAQTGALPSGRRIATWPMLLLASHIQRSQKGQINPDPFNNLMREISARPAETDVLTTDTTQARALEDDAVVWDDQLTVNLVTFFDPKLNPQNVQCHIEEAVDDLGNDLRLRSIDPMIYRSRGASSPGTLYPIQLNPRPAMGKRLKKLRGTVRFIVPVRHEQWEITDLKTTAGRSFSRNGNLYQLQFSGLERVGADWKAKFLVQARSEKVNTSGMRYRGWLGYSIGGSSQGNFGLGAANLIDQQGRSFGPPSTHYNTSDQAHNVPGNRAVSPPTPDIEKWEFREEQTATFSTSANARGLDPASAGGISPVTNQANSQLGMPVKLILNIPVEMREVSVPFEFTDLPLPPS